jgi:hypothetical protein
MVLFNLFMTFWLEKISGENLNIWENLLNYEDKRPNLPLGKSLREDGNLTRIAGHGSGWG